MANSEGSLKARYEIATEVRYESYTEEPWVQHFLFAVCEEIERTFMNHKSSPIAIELSQV